MSAVSENVGGWLRCLCSHFDAKKNNSPGSGPDAILGGTRAYAMLDRHPNAITVASVRVEKHHVVPGSTTVVWQNAQSREFIGCGGDDAGGTRDDSKARATIESFIAKSLSGCTPLEDDVADLLSPSTRVRSAIWKAPVSLAWRAANTTMATALREFHMPDGRICMHLVTVDRPVAGNNTDGRMTFVVHQTDMTDMIRCETELGRLADILATMLPRHVLDALIPGDTSFMAKRKTAGLEEGERRPSDGSSGDTDLIHDSAAVTAEDIALTSPRSKHLLSTARSHRDVTVMFMDVVGSTRMADLVTPREVMVFFNRLFNGLDDLLHLHRVQKVETAGDCYIVAAGVLEEAEDEQQRVIAKKHDPVVSALKVISFSQDVIRHANSVRMPHNGSPTMVRIGVHTGPIVSGLIGYSLPKFALFGDTMNVASRMEQTAPPGGIQVSDTTRSILGEESPHGTVFVPTGGIEVKGKGLMLTHVWVPS